MTQTVKIYWYQQVIYGAALTYLHLNQNEIDSNTDRNVSVQCCQMGYFLKIRFLKWHIFEMVIFALLDATLINAKTRVNFHFKKLVSNNKSNSKKKKTRQQRFVCVLMIAGCRITTCSRKVYISKVIHFKAMSLIRFFLFNFYTFFFQLSQQFFSLQ